MVNRSKRLINSRIYFLDQLDQTKGLEDLNRTLQSRCDHLENELSALRDRYNQGKTDSIQSERNLRSSSGENQSTIRQLKKENHFLKDYVHRLSATVSDYQTTNSSKAIEQGTSVSLLQFHLFIRYSFFSSERTTSKTRITSQRSITYLAGLFVIVSNMTYIFSLQLNQKYLAPLFVCYDEKIYQKDQFIKNLQVSLQIRLDEIDFSSQLELTDIHDQVETITKENVLIHERLARSSTSLSADPHLSEIEQIKRQAYLVLEENKVLQDQLDLQSNRLTDVQKHQIQEGKSSTVGIHWDFPFRLKLVSNLTRRLLIVESEKSEGDRILETIRIRNEDLKRKYEQLMLENNHRIHIQEHVQEVTEMKRLTGSINALITLKKPLFLHR